mmetsp:Transcript_57866/g.141919  ORF Transcript_57866/g.141919 Transcript_57866/m.141919 type:complete len:202 (+) Transcript_57866:509-1114(+)
MACRLAASALRFSSSCCFFLASMSVRLRPCVSRRYCISSSIFSCEISPRDAATRSIFTLPSMLVMKLRWMDARALRILLAASGIHWNSAKHFSSTSKKAYMILSSSSVPTSSSRPVSPASTTTSFFCEASSYPKMTHLRSQSGSRMSAMISLTSSMSSQYTSPAIMKRSCTTTNPDAPPQQPLASAGHRRPPLTPKPDHKD